MLDVCVVSPVTLTEQPTSGGSDGGHLPRVMTSERGAPTMAW